MEKGIDFIQVCAINSPEAKRREAVRERNCRRTTTTNDASDYAILELKISDEVVKKRKEAIQEILEEWKYCKRRDRRTELSLWPQLEIPVWGFQFEQDYVLIPHTH